ncbi:ribonuclease inhibitor [Stella humosa]|uniref:Ribonuclease inhibitor n=1 Tax=Stella humosa TaxID=94 RepID=A0A3N1L9J4_9PROT|nr:ribonuclease inhibitor [Stella humosa]BBK34257.1 putative ribonuclease inhibitor YrdF [Stella humosa]
MNQPRRVVIEGQAIATLARAWDALAGALDLPAHFGRNLDALHDCLTGDVPGPLVIEWRHWRATEERLGQGVRPMRETLEEAAATRDDLEVRFPD